MPEPKKSGNQACSEAMRERAYRQHRERLAAVKPSVDTSAPESAAYTRHVGRQGNQQKRYDQVDRDNQVLVERLVHVMNTKGGVDNSEPWRDHNKAIDSQRCRQKKQDAIDAENQRLLHRLQHAKPTYSTERLKKDRKKNETYANRISRYPYRPMDRPEPQPGVVDDEGRRRQGAGRESSREEREEDEDEDEEEEQDQPQQPAPGRQQTPPPAHSPHLEEVPEESAKAEAHSDDYESDDFEDEEHSREDSYHEIGSSEDEQEKDSEGDSDDTKEL